MAVRSFYGRRWRDSTRIMAKVLANRDLLLIQLRTAFVLDAYGRLAAVNEPGLPPAPRVFVATSSTERIVRVRSDIAEPVARLWLSATRDEDLLSHVSSHAEIQREHRGPAFVVPPLNSPEDSIVSVRSGVSLHPELVARGWKLGEAAPYVGVVRDGEVVSVCYSSRVGEEACEAGLETVTAFRGQGLGALAARAWASRVQRSGRLALYSTTWENVASQRVARKLAAEAYGENWHLT